MLNRPCSLLYGKIELQRVFTPPFLCSSPSLQVPTGWGSKNILVNLFWYLLRARESLGAGSTVLKEEETALGMLNSRLRSLRCSFFDEEAVIKLELSRSIACPEHCFVVKNIKNDLFTIYLTKRNLAEKFNSKDG